jgi:hypothetical protein
MRANVVISCTGNFSFGSFTKFKSNTIVDFIENAVEHSRCNLVGCSVLERRKYFFLFLKCARLFGVATPARGKTRDHGNALGVHFIKH